VEAVPERIAGTSLMEFPTMRSKKNTLFDGGCFGKRGTGLFTPFNFTGEIHDSGQYQE
jgi:hypothetical protein